MQIPPISKDDLEDVMQLSEELERQILKILEDQQVNIAMSALTSSVVHSILNQCESLDEIYFYRNCFFSFFTDSIKSIHKVGMKNSKYCSICKNEWVACVCLIQDEEY